MMAEWNSLFPPFRAEKAVWERSQKENRGGVGWRDRRWPPGRRRRRGGGAGGEEEEGVGVGVGVGVEVEVEEGVERREGHPGAPGPGSSLVEVLILLILIASTRAICPSKCVCNDKVLKAVCEYSNLEVVPIQLNPDIRHLKLNNNKIVSIHLTFIFYRNLVELDLSRNKVKSLGSKNFEFQVNLVRLNVSYNLVKNLHKDSFKGLSKLSVLDLSGNLIEEINDRMSFKDLHSLQELNLSRNNIYLIETGVFDYLVNLKRLVISDNQLMQLPDNAINTLDHLLEVDLSSNLIDDLSLHTPLKSLQVLHLRSNLIAALPNATLHHLPRLRRLDLSDNNLTRVPPFHLSPLPHLDHLNLSANLFPHLGPDAFRALHALRELYLDGGAALARIDSKAFLDLPNLHLVSLSNNPRLSRLPKFLFLNKPHLKHVRIAGNHFSTLDASDLPLDQLETLTLGRNPFTCNCSLHWLWILKERQAARNCTCRDAACYEACAEAAPKAERLADDSSDEDDSDDAPDPRHDDALRETNSRFRGLAFDKDVFPIILDLDEIYCEGRQDARKVLFRHAPESDFDCTATWILALTAALLALLLVFLLTAFAYILSTRCRRKPSNPVDTFINAAKTYEDTHHTYYRYGEALHNGEVFEVLKSGAHKAPPEKTNMYIKTPIDRPNGHAPAPDNPYRHHFPNTRDFYLNPPDNTHPRDTNIYQEPFASPAKHKRPPHIVYV